MIRFHSLQSRITALYLAAFGLAMILVAVGMQVAISRSAEEKVRTELASSARVINRIWSMRGQELESVARPLALDFGFREAVATDDDATIRSALYNITTRIDVSNAFVVKYDGRIVGMSPEEGADFDPRLWDELDSGWQSGALRLNDATYQAVAAEIKAPALIGWLVLGRRLDAGEVERLSALSAVPVSASVVRRLETESWVYDRTARPVADADVVASLERMSASASERPQGLSERLDGKMVLVRPLGTFGGVATTALVLDFSIADALAEYDLLKLTVLLAGLAGLVLVGLASVRLARHIVRPIAALEQAAKELEHGHWVTVPVASHDEIGSLSSSFNAMSAGIAQREQRIRHMAYHDALTDLPNRLHLADDLTLC
jgi:nitrogen fixation/metabolism regulation signal transduction histidine kinase